jgi:hypothetical protein
LICHLDKNFYVKLLRHMNSYILKIHWKRCIATTLTMPSFRSFFSIAETYVLSRYTLPPALSRRWLQAHIQYIICIYHL